MGWGCMRYATQFRICFLSSLCYARQQQVPLLLYVPSSFRLAFPSPKLPLPAAGLTLVSAPQVWVSPTPCPPACALWQKLILMFHSAPPAWVRATTQALGV